MISFGFDKSPVPHSLLSESNALVVAAGTAVLLIGLFVVSRDAMLKRFRWRTAFALGCFLVLLTAAQHNRLTTFLLYKVSPKAPAQSQTSPTDPTTPRSLPAATQSMKDACAREASGGFNYSAADIQRYANEEPGMAVAYAGCVMRRRQAGY